MNRSRNRWTISPFEPFDETPAFRCHSLTSAEHDLDSGVVLLQAVRPGTVLPDVWQESITRDAQVFPLPPIWPIPVLATVPEKNKKPGVCYALTDDGLELPIIERARRPP